jgi:CRISPR/Cas system-associated exonuclease Cas4 (RecB family)
MEIEHISVSRKSIFDLCEQKYKFRYHVKAISDGPEPFYFTYGKIVHKVAQVYVENKGKNSINSIAKDVLSGKIELEDNRKAPPLEDEYKSKFPNHLRNVVKITDKLGFEGEVEYPFKYDLDPPNERYVKGVIDRLIIKNDKYWILDYKTTKKGKFRKSARDITEDIQLRCYAKVVQKEFGAKAEDIKTALYYLDDNEMVGACFGQSSLDQAEQELLQAYMVIKSTDPSKVFGRTGDHCRRCEYKNQCPFYSLT